MDDFNFTLQTAKLLVEHDELMGKLKRNFGWELMGLAGKAGYKPIPHKRPHYVLVLQAGPIGIHDEERTNSQITLAGRQ